MNSYFPDHSSLFIQFLIVTVLSLIIGLEQRRHHEEQDESSEMLFGTDRTFTFIGILGFVLYILDPLNLKLFIGGGFIISGLLSIFYFQKIKERKKYGLTSILASLITFCLGPLIITQPQWLTLLIVVTVLVFTEMKEEFLTISKKFDKNEFIILAKFILIAGIILPNLPDNEFFPYINISPYKMWMAIVVTSGISYFSYLLQKFVFTKSGVVVSGILGGLYSSTAISIIVSRLSQSRNASPNQYASSVIFATTVMYFRVLLFILFLSPDIASIIFPYLLILFLISLLAGIVIYRIKNSIDTGISTAIKSPKNPLEFRVAILFAIFYVLFSMTTHYAETNYGERGLHYISMLAGLADVDSFVLNLVQGHFMVSNLFIASSIIIATTANNVIKMVYCIALAEKQTKRLIISGFAIIILTNLGVILYLNFLV
jgi:uncharacterized membrane protein (DUF4010 family)